VPCRVPGAGCWVLGAGCRVLGAGCRVPGCRVPGAGCWGAGCWMRGMGIARRLSMAARRYQDLDVWLLANELKKKVYALVDRSTARDDRRFCEQIRDSAASAPSNLAEGFACYKHPEFARYARFAKASLTETHNHLGDGVDRHHWSPGEATPLQELADRAVGACVRLLQYLESTDAPGTRKRRK
jgi:four helix bundle protein